jgi:hypothetical protein
MAKKKAPGKESISEEAMAFFRAAGQRGGLIGGKVSVGMFTKAERKARASKAGIASGLIRKRAAERRRREKAAQEAAAAT